MAGLNQILNPPLHSGEQGPWGADTPVCDCVCLFVMEYHVQLLIPGLISTRDEQFKFKATLPSSISHQTPSLQGSADSSEHHYCYALNSIVVKGGTYLGSLPGVN